MKIKIKEYLKKEWLCLEIKKPVTIEELLENKGVFEESKTFVSSLEYKTLVSIVNNRLEDLTYLIKDEDEIVLLDIRSFMGNRVYQSSLILLYIKAVKTVLGKEQDVIIENSLNQGMYTRFDEKVKIDKHFIDKLQEEMKNLINRNLPIKKEIVSREEALRIFREEGLIEKNRLILDNPNIKKCTFYSLDGYRDFFYGNMVPSTSYIEKFELVKCGKGIVLRFPQCNHPDSIPTYQNQRKLYNAFAKQLKWDNLLGINYVTDLNEKILKGEAKELILLSEAFHSKKIAAIADRIKRDKKKIILIAGPSSSGKTTFAKRLCIQLKVNGYKTLYMGTDDYFVERDETPLDERGERDYESLDAIDIELFNNNMNDLLEDKKVDLPYFNFLTGSKEFGKRITSISEDEVIVIEGIHALNEKLTVFIPKEAKFKIYISPLTQLNLDNHNRVSTTEERMLRRMVRDFNYRGKSAKETIREWSKVRKGEDENIFPYSDEADALFNSYSIYEISILKKYAYPLLEGIKEDEEEYAVSQNLIKFLDFFREIEDENYIDNRSIIREFIGGSVFLD